MVKCNVELRVVGVLMVTNVECRDDVSNWGDIEGEQDRPQDGTLGDSMFTDRWR